MPEVDLDKAADIGVAVKAAEKLLPAWFVPRMMTDEWTFGLLLTTGQILVIRHLSRVRQAADGTIWLDVKMRPRERESTLETRSSLNYLFAPSEELDASVSAAHVMVAFELEARQSSTAANT